MFGTDTPSVSIKSSGCNLVEVTIILTSGKHRIPVPRPIKKYATRDYLYLNIRIVESFELKIYFAMPDSWGI